jgi:hypothetical protein
MIEPSKLLNSLCVQVDADVSRLTCHPFPVSRFSSTFRLMQRLCAERRMIGYHSLLAVPGCRSNSAQWPRLTASLPQRPHIRRLRARVLNHNLNMRHVPAPVLPVPVPLCHQPHSATWKDWRKGVDSCCSTGMAPNWSHFATSRENS